MNIHDGKVFLLKIPHMYSYLVRCIIMFQPLLVPGDLVSEEDTKRIIETTIKHYDGLNILVSRVVRSISTKPGY